MVDAAGSRLHSAVRFSTIGNQLFVHSAFPTEQADAVFFGPDTYRFARAIAARCRACASLALLRIFDVGAVAGRADCVPRRLLADGEPEIVLSDINPLRSATAASMPH